MRSRDHQLPTGGFQVLFPGMVFSVALLDLPTAAKSLLAGTPNLMFSLS